MAARVADKIQTELDVECQVVFGRLGEFSVWLDDKKIAGKRWFRLPTDAQVLESARRVLG